MDMTFLSTPTFMRARVKVASFVHNRHERQATLFRRHILKVQACVLVTWHHRNTAVRRNPFTDHFLLVAVPESMLLFQGQTTETTTHHEMGDDEA
jgi:hypothetical protein|tara:strand:- start:299 stop:583 length:285 start_codon:yes stop_codon:yes gene_type:complete